MKKYYACFQRNRLPLKDYYSDIFCSLRSFPALQVCVCVWGGRHSSHPMLNHRSAGKTKQNKNIQTRTQRSKILNLHEKQMNKSLCTYSSQIVDQNLIMRKQKDESMCIGQSMKQLPWAPHNCQCHESFF